MLRNNNHRTRDYLRSEKIIKRKRRRTKVRLIFCCLSALIIFGGVFFVSRLDAFAVTNIKIEGNQDVTSEEITEVASAHASSSWLHLFPRRNIVLFPADDLEADLRARYPRFSEVMVRRVGINSVRIQVIERRPRALWCDTSEQGEQTEQCYAVDDQGYIYAPYAESAPMTSINVGESSTTLSLIRFFGGTQGTSTPIGTNLNSSSTFSDIAALLQGMKERGLNPERVQIRNNHEFSVKVQPSGEVIFSDIRPLSDSLENLSAALQSAAFKATSSPQTFEYIDTRFGNKIFFKMQK